MEYLGGIDQNALESYTYSSPLRSEKSIYRNVYTPSSLINTERVNKIENKISKRKLKKLHELFLKTDLIKNKISSIRNDAICNNFKVVENIGTVSQKDLTMSFSPIKLNDRVKELSILIENAK